MKHRWILFRHQVGGGPGRTQKRSSPGPVLHLAPGGLALFFLDPRSAPAPEKKSHHRGAGHSGRRILDAIRRRPHAGSCPERLEQGGGHLLLA